MERTNKLTKLASLAQTLEQQTAACKRCGICQAACPLFPHTGLEKDIARGKIAVLKGVMTETVKNARQVLDVLDRCLLCGRCAGVCPSGIDTLKIFIDARVLLTGYLGLSPSKKLIFRQILAHPERFEKVTRLTARLQPLFFKKSGQTAGTQQLRPSSSFFAPGDLSKRHLPPLPQTPFHRLIKTTDSEKPAPFINIKERPRVLFFAGCLIDKIFPQVGLAAVQALEHHGADIVFLQDELCCGIPALSAGDEKGFNQLLARNLEQIANQDFDLLVTACATCAFTIKLLWPQRVAKAGVDDKTIQEIAGKTCDISEFIVSHQPTRLAEKSAAPVPVTYHDPCHLKKSLGIFTEPRQLIEASANYRLVEMAGADACCGMGGGFGLKHGDLSRDIGQSKAAAIRQTGCKTVATSCPACMLQLRDILSEAGLEDINVKHVIELYMDNKK